MTMKKAHQRLRTFDAISLPSLPTLCISFVNIVESRERFTVIVIDVKGGSYITLILLYM